MVGKPGNEWQLFIPFIVLFMVFKRFADIKLTVQAPY
jgi:hypothetical protein